MKEATWLFKRTVTIFVPVFIVVFFMGSVILYWGSYYYFGSIFEDRVIDEYTYEKQKELGIENEWIVGVTAHNIDVVQAVHGDKVRDLVQQLEEKQTAKKQVYREKIDNKRLLIMIELDNSKGERIYRYSIIRDMYMEVLPGITLFFFIFLLAIFLLMLLFYKKLSDHLYTNISIIKEQSAELATDIYSASEIHVETGDEDVKSLAASFNRMKKRLIEKDENQQSMIRFISHELKTPTMVIKGYAQAGSDDLYPKGTPKASFEVIKQQADRIDERTHTLMRVSEYLYERGKEKDRCPIVLADLLAKVIDMVTPLTDIAIQVECDKAITIEGYETLLSILCENLINNQIRYCDSFITITAQQIPSTYKDTSHGFTSHVGSSNMFGKTVVAGDARNSSSIQSSSVQEAARVAGTVNVPAVSSTTDKGKPTAVEDVTGTAHVAAPAGVGRKTGRSRQNAVAHQKNTMVCIYFDNDGQIINERTYPEAFTPFSSKNEGGTGLGLAIAKEIAELHGGQLQLSDRDDLTRFILTLPLTNG
ncbi:MAG: HAMP domain-containing sensor histidine kinase [Actinomycetaceae bacterium]|nr:HAMP domain-containing sensor histidine kinase [Actinomycetaceae bacterium]